MDKYENIEFTFNSFDSVLELEDHFKQVCNIYSDAIICFDYAYALEYPLDEAHKKIIGDYEPLQILKYTSSRLALIELTKLYKRDDFFSLIKLLNKLKNNHYGKFNDNNFNIELLNKRIENLVISHEKTIGLRDMVFAHQDSRSKIKKTKVFEIGYNEVRNLFDETFSVLEQLHLMLKIAPYHKPIEKRRSNLQLGELLDSLLKD